MREEPDLQRALLDPGCYDHPVDRVELIETHISLIFLAGDYAYKLKKPLDLGFLDFSTPDLRRFYCQEEVRLNKRFAPGLYHAVVTIGGEGSALHIGGAPARDYLVKMKRFDQDLQFDRMLDNGLLSAEQLRSCARYLARLHWQATVASPQGRFGTVDAVMVPVQENFRQIRSVQETEIAADALNELELWSYKEGLRLAADFSTRLASGHVRECHGDLHLRNLAWIDRQPILFDCIEFDPALRWIDTVNDLAFLLMDLHDRKHRDLAALTLDAYLQESGDFAGLKLLNFYLTYRAMVRAKVMCLLAAQHGPESPEYCHAMGEFHDYLQLAATYTQIRCGHLLITHGLSGSGKTTIVNRLAPQLGAVCLHSDVERKRLYRIAQSRDSDSEDAIYSEGARNRIYDYLYRQARMLVAEGYVVIIDATFLQKELRCRARQLADACHVPLTILDFDVPAPVLNQRVEARMHSGDPYSDADLDVLLYQRSSHHPLGDDESAMVIRITPEMSVDAVRETLLARGL